MIRALRIGVVVAVSAATLSVSSIVVISRPVAASPALRSEVVPPPVLGFVPPLPPSTVTVAGGAAAIIAGGTAVAGTGGAAVSCAGVTGGACLVAAVLGGAAFAGTTITLNHFFGDEDVFGRWRTPPSSGLTTEMGIVGPKSCSSFASAGGSAAAHYQAFQSGTCLFVSRANTGSSESWLHFNRPVFSPHPGRPNDVWSVSGPAPGWYHMNNNNPAFVGGGPRYTDTYLVVGTWASAPQSAPCYGLAMCVIHPDASLWWSGVELSLLPDIKEFGYLARHFYEATCAPRTGESGTNEVVTKWGGWIRDSDRQVNDGDNPANKLQAATCPSGKVPVKVRLGRVRAGVDSPPEILFESEFNNDIATEIDVCRSTLGGDCSPSENLDGDCVMPIVGVVGGAVCGLDLASRTFESPKPQVEVEVIPPPRTDFDIPETGELPPPEYDPEDPPEFDEEPNPTTTTTGVGTSLATSTTIQTTTTVSNPIFGDPIDDPTDPDSRGDCLPSGWGLFNPVDWVVKPLKCVFRWAFVPSTALSARLATVRDSFSGSGVGVLISAVGDVNGAVGGVLDGLSGGNNCQGPAFKPLPDEPALYPFSSCSAPMSTFALFFRGLATAAVVVFTAVVLYNRVAHPLGVEQIRQDAASSGP